MNNQKWIAAVIAAAVAVSCFAAVFAAEPSDAADPPKTGHGSRDGVSLTYIDSETPRYGIMSLVLDEVPSADSLTVNVDGTESAPMAIPGDGRIVFATDGQLGLGDHTVIVSWTGFRTVIQFTVVYQGDGDDVTGITLDKESDTVLAGTSLVLTAALQPDGVTGHIEWSSSDTGVAIVADGRVSAVAAGTATITASCGAHTASFVLTVKTGTSEEIDTEIINDDGSVTTTTGTEIIFDDGSSWKEVTEVTESAELVRTTEIISETDTAGRTVSSETGTVAMKDSGVVLSVEKTSVAQGTEVTQSTLSLTVSDGGVSTTATETVADGKVTKTSVTTIDAQATAAGGKSSLDLDAATLNKVSAQMEAVSTQIDDVKPVMEISATTASSTKDAEVSLSAASLKGVADGTAADIAVTTDIAALTFSNGALRKVCETQGATVKVGTKAVTPADLTEDQRAKVGDNPVFSLSVSVGGTSVSDFGEGNMVTVSLPYTLRAGETALDVKVWCLTDSGLEEFRCTYADGYATFSTSHLSLWTVGTSLPSTDVTPGETSDGDDEKDISLYVGIAFLAFALLEAGALWFLIKR